MSCWLKREIVINSAGYGNRGDVHGRLGGKGNLDVVPARRNSQCAGRAARRIGAPVDRRQCARRSGNDAHSLRQRRQGFAPLRRGGALNPRLRVAHLSARSFRLRTLVGRGKGAV